MRALRVDRRNLYILRRNATVEQMLLNKRMEFAVSRVVQLVLDEDEKLNGIISDYSINSDRLDDYINYNFMYITEGGG